jgi:hypothetical protein
MMNGVGMAWLLLVLIINYGSNFPEDIFFLGDSSGF